ncbi:hypothetical protein [Faecalimicrobium dakarense]|uniref:hypothetical protein n=1 Tax=Faecalimicrobium dakarense TaxID=1301100 RepID=UPI0004B2197B|nr:hypothetical protein [[Clostridium] dakarense]
MKGKKLVTVGMAIAISLGAVACTKKTPAPAPTPEPSTTDQKNVPAGNGYSENYSKSYNAYMTGLSNYSMYKDTASVNEYYKTNKYPGNEKYVADLKAAYKDSRDKVKSFVDSLKNDGKTEDAKLKKMNEDLIAEGEKTIANLDERIKKLDELPKDIMNKSQDEFITAVDEATRIKDKTENGFNKMLEDMNKALGFKPNTTNNTNTQK